MNATPHRPPSPERDADDAGRTGTLFLLVEDDADHAHLINSGLVEARDDNTVVHVWDGEEALDYLHRRGRFADARRPDVIVLDLKLPGRDGHDVLCEIKGDASLRSIPVVVLSTSDTAQDRGRAYDNNANSYLVKPMSFIGLIEMIRLLDTYWGLWNKPAS